MVNSHLSPFSLKMKQKHSAIAAQCLCKTEKKYNRDDTKASSETQGQLVGAGKSLNGREKIRAKKSQEGEEKSLGTSAAFHYAEDSGNFGRNSNGKVRFGFF